MPLFKVPQRANKAQDMKLAKRSNTSKKSVATVKGGNNLMSRIAQIKANVTNSLGHLADNYMLITDADVLHDYISECISNQYISIDTETSGLDPLRDTLAGPCLFTRGQKGAYIPLNHISYITNERAQNQLDIDVVQHEFKRLLATHPYIDMFNATFDIRVLRANGIKDIYCTWDGYLASRILNENETYANLKDLHNKYVLKGQGDAFRFDDLFKGISFTLIPPNIGYLYAAHDPEITTELCDYQRKHLREDSPREDIRNMYWVFKNIEMPCVSVVADMEDAGVLFDSDYNLVLQEKYHKLLYERELEFRKVCEKYKEEIEAYRNSCVGVCKLENPINIQSVDQLAILMYDILKYPLFYDKKKKKETRSTAEEALLKHNTDVAKAILNYREFATLVSTFIDKMPNCVNPNDKRIHCHFNQYGARTGRFSSSDPNLQNIPSHNKDIRKMFKATDGYVLMSSDFSQQEPKCLAALCRQQGDSQMYDTFMQGKDLYSEIASKAFHKSYEECKEFNADGSTNKEGKERRTQAKSILLGVLYGRGENSIAEQLNVSEDEARQIKESVFKGFPAIKKFEQDSIKMAEDLGYVTTVCGRKRRLPDMQLPKYEFKWKDGATSTDLLDFEDETEQEIPDSIIDMYWSKLDRAYFKDKQKIKDQALKKHNIVIIENSGKIAEATRQCVNSRIQGSAADLTKIAMIELSSNKRLQELGFRLLIQVHDEVIAECPEENAKECSKLLAETMSKAAEKILEMPIKCDVEITKQWYGESVEL